MLIGPRVVATFRILDLDDLGAKIGKGLRTGRSGNDPGEIDHQQTVEGGRSTLRSRQTIGRWQSGSHGRQFPFGIVCSPTTLRFIAAGPQGSAVQSSSLDLPHRTRDDPPTLPGASACLQKCLPKAKKAPWRMTTGQTIDWKYRPLRALAWARPRRTQATIQNPRFQPFALDPMDLPEPRPP